MTTLRRLSTPPAWLLLLAAVPIVVMVVEVLGAPRLQFLDYWWVFDRVTNDDGSLHPRGILTYQNEHPMFLPGLLFWLEARLDGGYNQVLGLIDVLMTAVTVFLLHRLLPRTLGDTKRAALTVAFAFLLFSTNGLHNFAFGFSGIGWLSANLAAVGALLLAQRDRQAGAIAVGLLGCLCYGTAFAVWPALAVANWLRGRRAVWVALPAVIGIAVVAAWALTYSGKPATPSDRPLGLDSYLSVIAGTLGQLWSTDTDVAIAAGAITAVLLATFVGLAVRRRIAGDIQAPDSTWVGLAGYAVGATIMISVARASSGIQLSVSSRYASIPALALCALLALAALRWPAVSTLKVVVVAIAVGLTTFTVGGAQAHNVRGQYAQQQLLATAMRVRADRVVGELRADPGAIAPTRALGAYPFNGDFSLGCGPNGPELSSRIDLANVSALPGPHGPASSAGYLETPVAGDAVIGGWALINGKHADCVLIADQSGTVVGGGMVGIGRADVAKTLSTPETFTGWKAVAPPGLTNGVVLVCSGGKPYSITSAAPPGRG